MTPKARHRRFVAASLPLILMALSLHPSEGLCVSNSNAGDDEGFIGLALRDIPGGLAVVSWISPGPMSGDGLTSSSHDIARPDVIVSIDGQVLTADSWNDYIKTKAPGSTVHIDYRRSNARGGTIPSELNHQVAVQSIDVVVESRDEWTGTIHRGRSIRGEVTFDCDPFLDPHDPENILGKAIVENGMGQDLDHLLGAFREWQKRDDDFHSLSLVRAPFFAPFQMVELAGRMDLSKPREAPYWPEIDRTPNPVKFACKLVSEFVEVRGIGGTIGIGSIGPEATTSAGKELMSDLAVANVWRNMAFRDVSERANRFAGTLAPLAIEFLRIPDQTFYIDSTEAADALSVMKASLTVSWEFFGNALHEHERDSIPIDLVELRALPLRDPPEAAAGIIEGRVIEAIKTSRGWVVVGGPETNRYDMSKVIGVYDIGGDDAYYATDLCIGNRAIIDLAGNDHYTGTPDQGPASALFGFTFVDDRGGDDRYEGEMLSAGAAMYGVSLLLDRGGNDVYKGSQWSVGAACYGAGMIFDLGKGKDTYLGEFLCQGVGGPRGFGCILDDGGDDVYRANGPKESVYGTPGVHGSFSQGVGFGYRGYAAGGVGLISDLGGNDRYEAGEFAQGGAYYYGLGVLHDKSGNDMYYGNRYGQGFGVHQAHGILVDDEGDDTYYSMTAASQGAGWDIGAGLLLDRKGNDSYQCAGLGQGGASQQAIAMLIDLDGIDRYIAGGGATQGQSGGNNYHYHETGAFSFSLLMDLGGDEDYYSRGRQNNTTAVHGERNEENPENSGLAGLFIDQ